jgi:hypothetical protein
LDGSSEVKLRLILAYTRFCPVWREA